MQLFFYISFSFILYITGHDRVHITQFLYDEAGVYEWSCSGIIWITSHSCDEAGAGWVVAWNWSS
jgi:hypothetical protein